MIVDNGIQLIKFWLEVGQKEQERRLTRASRIRCASGSCRPWTSTRGRAGTTTRAPATMLEATDTKHAPWHILRSDDKRRARLNCIAHILDLIPYKKVPRDQAWSCRSARRRIVTTIRRACRAEGSSPSSTESGVARWLTPPSTPCSRTPPSGFRIVKRSCGAAACTPTTECAGVAASACDDSRRRPSDACELAGARSVPRSRRRRRQPGRNGAAQATRASRRRTRPTASGGRRSTIRRSIDWSSSLTGRTCRCRSPACGSSRPARGSASPRAAVSPDAGDLRQRRGGRAPEQVARYTGLDRNFVTYQVGFDAAWELDFWGKYRRGVEAEGAALLASVADYHAAFVSLTAEVARTYVAIRTAEVLIEQAQDNARIQEEALRIAEARFQAGATSELDPTQATTLLESTRASVPRSRSARSRRATPSTRCSVSRRERSSRCWPGPRRFRSRPRRWRSACRPRCCGVARTSAVAELYAAAQCARIGVAKAELYPSFSLFGTIGLRALQRGDGVQQPVLHQQRLLLRRSQHQLAVLQLRPPGERRSGRGRAVPAAAGRLPRHRAQGGAGGGGRAGRVSQRAAGDGVRAERRHRRAAFGGAGAGAIPGGRHPTTSACWTRNVRCWTSSRTSPSPAPPSPRT